jgi:hypothetical protein
MSMDELVPVSTRLSMEATNESGVNAIKSVYMIVDNATGSKGTGFLLANGKIITNSHVVQSRSTEHIIGISSIGEQIRFNRIVVDIDRDLASLEPTTPLSGGLVISKEANLSLGTKVAAWGFPLHWNGPNPLLSVGYIAGYTTKQNSTGTPVKQVVINGALNNGNSGGPLVRFNDDKIVGVVVSKALPIISRFAKDAITVFSNNRSGIVYSGTDRHGNPIEFVESQIVATVLDEFHKMHQVMIGEAISIEELIKFLQNNSIDIPME